MPDPLVVSYRFDSADCAAYRTYLHTSDPHVTRAYQIIGLGLPLCLLVGAVVASFADEPWWGFTVIFGLLAPLFFLARDDMFWSLVKWQMRFFGLGSLFREGEHTLRIDSTHFKDVCEGHSVSRSWRDVTGLVSAPDHVIFTLRPFGLVTVPRDAFASEDDVQAFVGRATKAFGEASAV